MSAHADPIRPRGLVARVGGWAARRRRAVLIGWLVALVGVVAVSQSAGTDYRNSASLQGTDSQRAAYLLERDFPAKSGDSDQVVFRARNGRMTDPAVCVPNAMGTMPAETAAADPDDEPPGVWSSCWGLRVLAGWSAASSVVTVLPIITAPAALASATHVASMRATFCA